MRRVAAIAVLVCVSSAAFAQPKDNPQNLSPAEENYLHCVFSEKQTVEQRLDICTTAIRSGALMGEDLGDLYLARAQIYDHLKKEDEALSDANEGVRLLPMEADSYFQRALIYEARDDADHAFADFTKTIELEPASSEAYAERAYIQLDRNAPDLAFADFSNAVKYDPKMADGYVGRGAIYLTRNQYALAKADFDTVLGLENKNPEALYGRGIAEQRLGDKAKGDADIAAGERIYPKAGEMFKILKIVP